MKQLQAEFPFELGEAVGHLGRHARVIGINPRNRHTVRVQYTDYPREQQWVSLGQIHEPPRLPDHIERAGREVAGILRDPRAVFGEGK